MRGPLPASALPRFITFLCPVDDVYSALAPHQLVGAVARAQGFQGIADFHRRVPKKQPALGAGWKRCCDLCPIRGRRSTLKPNVWNARSCSRPDIPSRTRRGVPVHRLSQLPARNRLPLARIMLYGDGRDGTAHYSLAAAFAVPRSPTNHGNASIIDVNETSDYSRRNGDLRLLRFGSARARGFSPLQQFRQPGECFSSLYRWRNLGQRGLVEFKTKWLRDIGAGGARG